MSPEVFRSDGACRSDRRAMISIDNGECDPTVREAIEALAEVAGQLGDFGDLSDFV